MEEQLTRANRELQQAKESYDFIIAPKNRSIAETRKNTLITNRKKESAQIRVNQVATTIGRMTKKIEFKRIDVHSVASRNGLMTSKLQDKEHMLRTLRSGIAEAKMRSSKRRSPASLVKNWNNSMIAEKKAFHSQSETRAQFESAVSMINELKAAKSFVSSVITMPTSLNKPLEEHHMQAVALLKDRIGVAQQSNRSKVAAIVDYIERMQTLDDSVSAVINSPLSNGDVEGTIAVFAQALGETNDKIAYLSLLTAESEQVAADIASAKQQIRLEHQRSLAFDVARDQDRLQQKYFSRHLQEKKLR